MLTTSSTQLGLRLTSRQLSHFTSRAPAAATSRCSAIPQTSSKSLHSGPLPTRVPSKARSLATRTPTQRRHATTTAPSQPQPHSPLNWNNFFGLRTTRRYYSLTSSLIGLLATTTGTFYFLTSFPDQSDYVVKLIPMDPVISMGIAMTAAMFTGWLLGPIFGNAIWRLLYRKRLPEFTSKERAFFERIKKHRVNPAGASTNNPVPDFYGEKIGSVQGYRRWLKDQRAFNRKRGADFVNA